VRRQSVGEWCSREPRLPPSGVQIPPPKSTPARNDGAWLPTPPTSPRWGLSAQAEAQKFPWGRAMRPNSHDKPHSVISPKGAVRPDRLAPRGFPAHRVSKRVWLDIAPPVAASFSIVAAPWGVLRPGSDLREQRRHAARKQIPITQSGHLPEAGGAPWARYLNAPRSTRPVAADTSCAVRRKRRSSRRPPSTPKSTEFGR